LVDKGDGFFEAHRVCLKKANRLFESHGTSIRSNFSGQQSELPQLALALDGFRWLKTQLCQPATGV